MSYAVSSTDFSVKLIPPGEIESNRDSLIEQGQLLMGIVDKKIVGARTGNIIHLVWLERGPEQCKHFIIPAKPYQLLPRELSFILTSRGNEIQLIVGYYLMAIHSSSIGDPDLELV